MEDVSTRRPWTKFHTAFVLIIVAIQLPELHAFFTPDSDPAWRIYFLTNELSKAALCLALGLTVHRALYGFALWYLLQGADSWWNFDLWEKGKLEYVVLVLLAWVIWKRK